jgi:hypothetical protein|tara:strand:- start:2605 stop:3024 length:420 start_codon:yes stop_codon:yes gene_type:complete
MSKVRYEIDDKVVFKTEGVAQVGVITNVRSVDSKVFYDLRSEKGQGFLLVSVDKAKNKFSESYALIDSNLTSIWNGAAEVGDVEPTKLFAKDGVGHTRANYAENIELWFDGENVSPNVSVQQIEKRNDFIFPTQGPRSY